MQTIVCLPMCTQSADEFRDALVKQFQGEYLFAGSVILHTKENVHIECEVCDYDPTMRNAFASTLTGRVDESDIDEIDKHQSVIYLTYEKADLDDLHVLHQFINVCLQVGGLGVKFENSGLAHTKDMWLNYNFYENTYLLLNSHVMYIHDEHYVSSVGMHIFGLPDVSIPISASELLANANGFLTKFNHYHVFETPTFKEGNTFSLGEDEPKFVIAITDDFVYQGEDCFENPFGRLLLSEKLS